MVIGMGPTLSSCCRRHMGDRDLCNNELVVLCHEIKQWHTLSLTRSVGLLGTAARLWTSSVVAMDVVVLQTLVLMRLTCERVKGTDAVREHRERR